MFLLWWCIDDHLARSLEMPGVGSLDWWVVLLASVGLSLSSGVIWK